MKLPPLDKQAHFFAGAAIASTYTVYTGDALGGFLLGAAIGAGKEFIDPYIGGHSDALDFLATVLGAAVVLPQFALKVWAVL